MEKNIKNTVNGLNTATDGLAKATGNILSGTVGIATGGVSSFMDILKTYNIIGVCLGMLIARSVYDIVQTIINSIILPTFREIVGNNDFKSTKVKIGVVTFEIEDLIKQLLNFFCLVLIILFVFKFLIRVSNPIQYVKIVKE